MSEYRGTILLTGGLGYIGSHVAVELLQNNYQVIIVDDLSNSKAPTLETIKTLSGVNHGISWYLVSVCDYNAMDRIFKRDRIDWVIHMAGFKAVEESIKKPLEYYQNNLGGTLTLLNVMRANQCQRLIFSSSATVYGNQPYPVDEQTLTGHGITNPYGRTKCMIEEILKDIHKSDPTWQIVILRYFNPVASHPSGCLPENPNGYPNNLFPILLNIAKSPESELTIFGKDYSTRDGTCVRDFIHVVDLAKGHLAPLLKLDKAGLYIYNLGTSKGTTILELVNRFSLINGIKIKYQFGSARDGDLPEIYGKVDKAQKELGWKAERTLDDICRDGWQSILSSKVSDTESTPVVNQPIVHDVDRFA